MIEGVDYAWGGPPTAAQLLEAGKHFAGRYAVSDKSPDGRGITADEYAELAGGGVDVFLYWEASEAWMLGGWNAGVAAANNATNNVRGAGMPEGMPVYYSHDVEPDPNHYAAIDDCLRGAASVVGVERVGLYGGYGVIDHVSKSKTANWLCQTYAWSGGNLHPAAHLYQYNNYGNSIAGVDVDLVQALKNEYGQARSFIEPQPPQYPEKRIPAPDTMSSQGYVLLANANKRWQCIQGGRLKTAPSRDAPDVKDRSGNPILYRKGRNYSFAFTSKVDGEDWLVSERGSWAVAKNFTQ
jgi:hypothetical protein